MNLENGDLLHKKVCALEIRSELDRTLLLVISSLIGVVIGAGADGTFRMVVLGLLIGVIAGFGVRAMKKKNYLENKYNLNPTFNVEK